MKTSHTFAILLIASLFLTACGSSVAPVTETAVSSTPLPTPIQSPFTAIVDEQEPGEPLAITINFLDEGTGEPIPAAELWIRHTTDAGIYDEDTDGNPRIQGTLLSDENGQIQVATILPGAYDNDPTAARHIHLSITAAGYEDTERVIHFDNDPNLTEAQRTWELSIVAAMDQNKAGEWSTNIYIPLTPIAATPEQTFILLPEQSTVSYQVEEEFLNKEDWLSAHGLTAGLATAIGSTNQIEGSLQIDLSQSPPIVGENQFSVDLMSLRSDQEGRDNSVQRDIFGNGRFGTATFIIHQLTRFPEKFEEGAPISFIIEGDLTIRETTQPVAFAVTAQFDNDQITGTATTQIEMSDFNITPPNLLGILTVSETVTIDLEFVLQDRG